MAWPQKSEVARSVPFSPTSPMVSTNVQDAIDELVSLNNGKLDCVTFGYNGTANVGRWLENITNNPSSANPLIIAGSRTIKALSLSTDTNSTGTITLYKNGASVATISLTAAKKQTVLSLSISLANLDELSAKVTSGTFSRPVLGVWG